MKLDFTIFIAFLCCAIISIVSSSSSNRISPRSKISLSVLEIP